MSDSPSTPDSVFDAGFLQSTWLDLDSVSRIQVLLPVQPTKAFLSVLRLLDNRRRASVVAHQSGIQSLFRSQPVTTRKICCAPSLGMWLLPQRPSNVALDSRLTTWFSLGTK